MKYLRISLVLLACLALTLTLTTHLSGCAGPAYYAQAVSGHMKLMRSRVPISELLDDPATDPELASRLHQANDIRVFAHNNLGLTNNDSYSQFAPTGKEAVTWNVVAAPEFSVNPRLWCFPVSGCVPYRGYFDEDKARSFAEKMKAKSFDVMISPAIAYSTLGWFDDPLLDTMLQYSDAQLAGIMFHELAHEKLYVKSDTAFSEAFAGFVEETGVQLWLEKTGQEVQLTQWQAGKQAALDFNRLLQDVRQQLQEIYIKNLPEEAKLALKRETLLAWSNRYRELVKQQWNDVDYFATWMSGELNNAHLALMNSYEGGSCAFTALYAQAGHELEPFYVLAEQKASLGAEQRSAWLGRPCDDQVTSPQ